MSAPLSVEERRVLDMVSGERFFESIFPTEDSAREVTSYMNQPSPMNNGHQVCVRLGRVVWALPEYASPRVRDLLGRLLAEAEEEAVQ
jgi:hypothetical protein